MHGRIHGGPLYTLHFRETVNEEMTSEAILRTSNRRGCMSLTQLARDCVEKGQTALELVKNFVIIIHSGVSCCGPFQLNSMYWEKEVFTKGGLISNLFRVRESKPRFTT